MEAKGVRCHCPGGARMMRHQHGSYVLMLMLMPMLQRGLLGPCTCSLSVWQGLST